MNQWGKKIVDEKKYTSDKDCYKKSKHKRYNMYTMKKMVARMESKRMKTVKIERKGHWLK